MALNDTQVLIFRGSEILDRVMGEPLLISHREVIEPAHEHLQRDPVKGDLELVGDRVAQVHQYGEK